MERRREARTRLSAACKVLDPRSGKYLPASTIDVSASGVQVLIERGGAPEPGERLHVGIAAPGTGLLRRADLAECEVVRVVRSPDGRAVVGMRLANEIIRAAAA